MKRFVALVIALAMFTAFPALAAKRNVTLDAIALRESVVALDHEWIGSDPVSTELRLALGSKSVEDAEMSLLGLAIGKRGYAYGVGHPDVGIYAGGYLFGQTVTASVMEMPENYEDPTAQSVVSETPRFTERRTAVGLMSEIGLRFQAAKNFTIDIGPEVTVPFVIQRTNTDGQKETQRFPSIAYNWRMGLGYSW